MTTRDIIDGMLTGACLGMLIASLVSLWRSR